MASIGKEDFNIRKIKRDGLTLEVCLTGVKRDRGLTWIGIKLMFLACMFIGCDINLKNKIDMNVAKNSQGLDGEQLDSPGAYPVGKLNNDS